MRKKNVFSLLNYTYFIYQEVVLLKLECFYYYPSQGEMDLKDIFERQEKEAAGPLELIGEAKEEESKRKASS